MIAFVIESIIVIVIKKFTTVDEILMFIGSHWLITELTILLTIGILIFTVRYQKRRGNRKKLEWRKKVPFLIK